MAIAAAPSHLNFTAAAPLMQFSACVLRTCVGAEIGAWVWQRGRRWPDSWISVCFGAFVAAATGQLAAG